MVEGINVTEKQFDGCKKELCEPCVLRKQHRLPFPTSTGDKATAPLGLVHMDLCGPMQVKSSVGNWYLPPFLDDRTGMSVLRSIARKSDAIDEIKSVITQLETQYGHRVLQLQTDRGGEYINKEVKL